MVISFFYRVTGVILQECSITPDKSNDLASEFTGLEIGSMTIDLKSIWTFEQKVHFRMELGKAVNDLWDDLFWRSWVHNKA